MSKKILMGASFLALLAAFPAFADTKVDANADTSAKVEAKLDQAGNAIERTADKAAAKTKEAYRDVKAYFNDDDDAPLSINARLTADELIGTNVQDMNGKTLGEIKDILVSADGDAETVIITDSALGLGGKLAAFDYDVIKGFTKDNDAIVKLSEANIKSAKKFEYKSDNADANTIVMPADQYSVSKIMDSNVYDANGKVVAEVDTVAFDGDDADYVIVTFNQILGMGGDKAALNMDALKIVPKDDNYAFTLTQQQSAQFETAKDNSKAN